MSPTIHHEAGYLFYFFSADVRAEPPHVHVGQGRQRGDDAKFWLEPVSIAHTGRFNRRDVRRMVQIIEQQREAFLEEWHAYRTRL